MEKITGGRETSPARGAQSAPVSSKEYTSGGFTRKETGHRARGRKRRSFRFDLKETVPPVCLTNGKFRDGAFML